MVNDTQTANQEDDKPYGNLIVPPLPAEEMTHHVGPDTSTTTPTFAVDPLKNLADRKSLSAEEMANADRAATRQAGIEDVQRTQAHDELEALKQQEKDRTDAIARSQPQIDAWTEHLKAAREQYENQPFPALFADQSDGQRALIGLGLALGAIGQGISAKANVLAGGNGQVHNTVGDIIDADITRQKDKIKGLSDRVVMAKAGLDDAEKARALLMAEVDAKGAVAAKKAAAIAKASLTSQGLSNVEVERHKAYIEAQEKSQTLQNEVSRQVVSNATTENKADVQTTRDQKPDAAKTGIPTIITDDLTGQDLPVDPNRTDQRKHNTATGKLPQINTFIKTATELIDDAQKNGPQNPEVLNGIIGDGKANDTAQSERNATMVRLRSAYAAAKGESIGAENMKHLEHALPDPPSTISTAGMWNNWKAKINAVTQEMAELRKQELSNAGVPPEYLAKVTPKNAHLPSNPRSEGNSLIDLTHGTVGGNAPHSKGPDLRLDPSSLPAPSLPAGPATETPGNSPDNVNSEAPLPEDPSAPTIDDIQGKATAKPARGVGPMKARPVPTAAPAPVATQRSPGTAPGVANVGPTLTPRQVVINWVKAQTDMTAEKRAWFIKRYEISPEELR